MAREDKDRERRIEKLDQFVEEVSSVACTKCGTCEGKIMGNADDFYDDGWRATDKNVYCPSCADKFGIK